jgi:hypothetical protein
LNCFVFFKELFVILWEIDGMNDKIDDLFTCDTCNKSFAIDSGGFLGEESHLIDLLCDDNKKKTQAKFSCSPFTTLISLCYNCFTKEQNKK